MHLSVSTFLSPEVEGSGCEFIDYRVCEATLGEVYSLDVSLAGVAALHSNVRELFGRIDRKSLVVFLGTIGTVDATELPLAKTE